MSVVQILSSHCTGDKLTGSPFFYVDFVEGDERNPANFLREGRNGV